VQATVLSPWIVQHEALVPFMCAAPEQDPEPLPYLQDSARTTFDLTMKVEIQPEICKEKFTVSTARFRDLYWTFEQMLTHHTAGGCNVKAGDVIASGTVSSEGDGAQGCLLELTENGKCPLQLSAGCQRTWLENGDTVSMSAIADNGSIRIGFGPCKTTVAPAVMYRP
jgi:fumarylacetoacetase